MDGPALRGLEAASTFLPFAMEYLLNHLLTNSAARHPAKEAVRIDGSALTYWQLDRLTNQVARSLRAAGVQRRDRVGIYVHKSLASVICMFGIMKAGAAYVPLDPNAPAKRLAYITRDCGIKVLLTSAAELPNVRALFTEGTPLRTIVLTDDFLNRCQLCRTGSVSFFGTK